MKLFVNDWSGNRENFIMNIEENMEYPVNTWITTNGNHRAYLMSAYLYDEFVMFFYIYELCHINKCAEQSDFKTPQTHRDLITLFKKGHNRMTFEYEVNYLKSGRGSIGECLPKQRPENIPVEKQDDFFEMHFGEYDYLCDLVKGRLPEELQGVELAFRKDCYSFAEPVTEIKNIAVYPPSHEIRQHFIDKTFTIPYGECDIKIPYIADGIQSYIIVQELKILDMLKEFENRYDEFKKAHENNLQELEKNKGMENQTVLDLDEIRSHWDKRILTISYLKPEEHLSFEFYTTEHLNSQISSSASYSNTLYFFSLDKDKKMKDGLYKGISSLGEVNNNPNAEYEITLMKVSESIERERNAVLEIKF